MIVIIVYGIGKKVVTLFNSQEAAPICHASFAIKIFSKNFSTAIACVFLTNKSLIRNRLRGGRMHTEGTNVRNDKCGS